jgi:hypothetical protein
VSYEGEERRKTVQTHCIHENDWGKMMASVENLDRRINGSLHEMEKHMDDGKGWRMSLIGIIVAIFLQIVTFSYLWGGLTTTVNNNTKKWAVLEPEHQELVADVHALKEKSYGYRDIPVVVNDGKLH